MARRKQHVGNSKFRSLVGSSEPKAAPLFTIDTEEYKRLSVEDERERTKVAHEMAFDRFTEGTRFTRPKK